jgi:hypothetical protein
LYLIVIRLKRLVFHRFFDKLAFFVCFCLKNKLRIYLPAIFLFIEYIYLDFLYFTLALDNIE